MALKSNNYRMGLIIASALALGACGDSDLTFEEPQSGKLKGLTVSGLNYTTSSGSGGVTSEDGSFEFTAGDTITFSLGGIELGSVNAATETDFFGLADALMPSQTQMAKYSSSYFLGGCHPKRALSKEQSATDEKETQVNVQQNSSCPPGGGGDLDDGNLMNNGTNKNVRKALHIAMLLQSADDDGSMANGININADTQSKLANASVDWDSGSFNFQSQIRRLFTEVGVAAHAKSPLNTINNMITSGVITTATFRHILSEYDDGPTPDGIVDNVNTYTYDANGYLATQEYDYEPDGIANRIYSYTNDANGNATQIAYDYDGDGNPSHISYFTYDANGNLLSNSYDNQADGDVDHTNTYTYDANGNQLTYSYDNNVNGLDDGSTTYTYDAQGNLAGELYSYNLEGTPSYNSRSYTYDANNNLVTESYDTGNDGTVNWVNSFTYDANNNLLSRSHDGNNDGTTDSSTVYSYDASNNLLSSADDYQADGVIDYIRNTTWDSEGNNILIEQGSQENPSYIIGRGYDLAGNVISQSEDYNADGVTDNSYTNTYDADNNLLSTEYSNNNGYTSIQNFSYEASPIFVLAELFFGGPSKK